MSKTATKPQSKIEVPPEPPAQLPSVVQDRPPLPRPERPEPKQYPGKIAKSIIAITKEIGRIQKAGFNDFQRYRYTRWEDIVEKLSPLLSEHGIVIVQSEISRNLIEDNDKGSTLAIVYHFTLVNEHGDQWPEVEWTAISRLRDQKGVTDDKAAAKCHTAAEKQFCIKLFKIRSDDVSDPDDAHQTLPKKNARDVYQKMQDEIDNCQTLVEIDTWKRGNMERTKVLPKDWWQILSDRFSEKRADLENQQRGNPEYDDETGEIFEPSAAPSHQSAEQAPHKASSVSAAPKAAPPQSQTADGAAELTTDEADAKLAEAASKGSKALQQTWENELTKEHRKSLKAALDRRHKINAMKADAAEAK
ncbi:MAG TPA: ERF family protein [Pirellulales bacterium]